MSDATGEDEIWLVAQDGSGEPEQLTTGGQAMLYAPEWSPTGKHLAFSDKDGKLYVIDVETKEVVEVADEARGPLRDYVWSPRGGYLAFSMTDPTEFSSIWVWSLADRACTGLPTSSSTSGTPAWDPDGEYLYYLSDRQFARSSVPSSGTTWSTARRASTLSRYGRTWSIRCRRRATRWR